MFPFSLDFFEMFSYNLIEDGSILSDIEENKEIDV
jgi:hypothetical protein